MPPATHAAVTCFSPGGAAGRHHAPLGAGQLGQPLADRVGQFVHLHEVLGGRIHGGADFGQLDGSADDSERPAAIDDGFNADRLVDLAARA